MHPRVRKLNFLNRELLVERKIYDKYVIYDKGVRSIGQLPDSTGPQQTVVTINPLVPSVLNIGRLTKISISI